MNANQKNQIAAALFGQPTFDGLQRVSATAVGDSANGLVTIEFDDGSQIEADTIGAIANGETVQVDVQNGHATVIGAAGWGDRLYIDVDGLQTLVHEYSGGVLVAKVGQPIGALVNANGSFDVVNVSWSASEPTLGDVLSTFGSDSIVIGRDAREDEDGQGPISDSAAKLVISAADGLLYRSSEYTVDGVYYADTLLNINPYPFYDIGPARNPDDGDVVGRYSLTNGAVHRMGIFHSVELANTASGDYSHAEGNETEAKGKASHSDGFRTVAAGDYQSVIGRYNAVDGESCAFIVGNGYRDSAGVVHRSNAFAVAWDGTALLGGKSVLVDGSADYTADESLPDDVGGSPNPDKNIVVDNGDRTIQAELLTAAQTAAMLS